MKFKICTENDEIIITGKNIDEVRKKAQKEVLKRGWTNYWSEKTN